MTGFGLADISSKKDPQPGRGALLITIGVVIMILERWID